MAVEFGPAATAAAAAVALAQVPVSKRTRTLTTARPAWEALAARYAATVDAEAALYRAAGGEPAGVAWLADQSTPGIRRSGGAMALFAFPETN